MLNIKLLNPGYEYLFFDDMRVEEFIQQEYPQYIDVFHGFQHRIQRYDFFRYLAVYHHGGFYFDLDVMLASDLSQLLDLGCVFPFEGLTFSKFLRLRHNMDWEVGNYAFGAAAGHPFLEAVIENCVRAQRDPDWVRPMMQGIPPLSRAEFKVLNSTGPGLVSRTLAENPMLAKTVAVLFPDDVCDSRNWNCFGDLGVHLMEGSWRPSRGFFRRRIALKWEAMRLSSVLRQSRRLGTKRVVPGGSFTTAQPISAPQGCKDKLVSILIPAYNAEDSIADTVRSALAQTWPCKEIIVVDDGSTDRTLEVARSFEANGVQVVAQSNQGAAAARNQAFSLSKGEYIQWLDADDLLAPDKIALQMEASHAGITNRTLLSSAWGRFMYRYHRARFVPTALWADLSPVEWLSRKMGQNLYMQTSSWLVSRELSEAAGPWDTRLLGDDDGEYFCRVLLASNGVRFIPDAKVYYRGPGLAFRSLSFVGNSTTKLDAHWLSMQLHIRYLCSLEQSEKVRAACLRYLQMSLIYFYPERQDIIQSAQGLARELGGQLEEPFLSWKYSWMKSMFGWRLAKMGQRVLLRCRWASERLWDRTLFRIESPRRQRYGRNWVSSSADR